MRLVGGAGRRLGAKQQCCRLQARWAIDITAAQLCEYRSRHRSAAETQNPPECFDGRPGLLSPLLAPGRRLSARYQGALPRLVRPLEDPPPPSTDSHPDRLSSVTAYEPSSATLTLSHPPAPGLVDVEVSLVVATLPFAALRRGEWVNVIGYTAGARVDAVMLWSAAGVNLGAYEKTLRERLDVDVGVGVDAEA